MNKIIDLLQSSLHELLTLKEHKTHEMKILQRRVRDKENEIWQLQADIASYQDAIEKLKDNNE